MPDCLPAAVEDLPLCQLALCLCDETSLLLHGLAIGAGRLLHLNSVDLGLTRLSEVESHGPAADGRTADNATTGTDQGRIGVVGSGAATHLDAACGRGDGLKLDICVTLQLARVVVPRQADSLDDAAGRKRCPEVTLRGGK